MAGLPGIITCSALKRIYRDRMRGDHVFFVHLTGDKDTIGRRITARQDHFMPPALLDTQIATLEPPGPGENVLEVDLGRPPAEEASEIIARLGLDPGTSSAPPLGDLLHHRNYNGDNTSEAGLTRSSTSTGSSPSR